MLTGEASETVFRWFKSQTGQNQIYLVSFGFDSVERPSMFVFQDFDRAHFDPDLLQGFGRLGDRCHGVSDDLYVYVLFTPE